jgi:hypothetical protein
MSGIDWQMAAGGMFALALAALAVYAAVLARRMRAARGELAEMRAALIELARIVGRANREGQPQEAAQMATQMAAKGAEDLRDDLAFLVERGAMLADRLERDLRLGLVRQRQAIGENPGKPGGASTGGKVVSLPERTLIKTLKGPR